jgi:hypothetical protein
MNEDSFWTSTTAEGKEWREVMRREPVVVDGKVQQCAETTCLQQRSNRSKKRSQPSSGPSKLENRQGHHSAMPSIAPIATRRPRLKSLFIYETLLQFALQTQTPALRVYFEGRMFGVGGYAGVGGDAGSVYFHILYLALVTSHNFEIGLC